MVNPTRVQRSFLSESEDDDGSLTPLSELSYSVYTEEGESPDPCQTEKDSRASCSSNDPAPLPLPIRDFAWIDQDSRPHRRARAAISEATRTLPDGTGCTACRTRRLPCVWSRNEKQCVTCLATRHPCSLRQVSDRPITVRPWLEMRWAQDGDGPVTRSKSRSQQPLAESRPEVQRHNSVQAGHETEIDAESEEGSDVITLIPHKRPAPPAQLRTAKKKQRNPDRSRSAATVNTVENAPMQEDGGLRTQQTLGFFMQMFATASVQSTGPDSTLLANLQALPGIVSQLKEIERTLSTYGKEQAALSSKVDGVLQSQGATLGEITSCLRSLKEQPGATLNARRAQKEKELSTQLEKVSNERDEALSARDEAVIDHYRAVMERDDAVAEKKEMLVERDEAIAHWEEAIGERDEAVSQRDQAVAGQEKATYQRNRAMAERDEAVAERKKMAKQKAATRWFANLVQDVQDHGVDTAGFWARELASKGINLKVVGRGAGDSDA